MKQNADKRLEETLRGDEESFRVMADRIPQAIWVTNAAGRIEFVNQAYTEYFGVTLEDVQSVGWQPLIHPDDEAAYVGEYMACLRDHRPFFAEVRARRHDGEWRWVESFGWPRLSPSGEFLGISGSSPDITERKQAERKLAEQALMFANISDAAIGFDLECRITYYSKSAEKMYGYSAEEVIGRCSIEIFKPSYLNITRQEALQRLTETGQLVTEAIHTTKDGRKIIVESHEVLLYDDHGNPTGLIGTNRDITQRKRAEEALRKAHGDLERRVNEGTADLQRSQGRLEAEIEERKQAEEALKEATRLAEKRAGELDAVFATFPDGLVIYDKDGQPTYINDTVRKIYAMYGTRQEDELPVRVDKFRAYTFDGRLLAPEATPLRQTLKYGETIKDFVTILHRGTEPSIYTSMSCAPIRNSNGEIAGAVATYRDITERQQAEEVLREADRQKNEFLAVLSHELRNPLAAIRSSLDILDRVPSGGEQAKRAKDIIDRQAGQLAHLVDDLLDVTRITQNKITLQRERLDLNELLRRVFEDFQTAFEKNGVSLEQELDLSPIFVTADRTRLAQVFGNLLQNAVKFTPRGGRVIVSAALDPAAERAIVRVADTGIGIEPEMIPRLFKPFVQIGVGLDRHEGGLGLGLALVKGLVELHGGEVTVSSLGSGQGTEFTIGIPWEGGEAAETRIVSAMPHSRRRILVIEDNSDLAESMGELLGILGHEVAIAGSGPEGLDMAHKMRPGILLCDIGLPGMDGYAVARAFRADERLKEVFLVALTGYAQPEDLERVAAAGFDRHLAKPVEIETLERLLGEGVG